MLVYFIRRTLHGLTTLLLTWLIVYSFVIYGPGGPVDMANAKFLSLTTSAQTPTLINSYEALYGFNKPWPLSYASWLFDPDRLKPYHWLNHASGLVHPTGINLTIFGLHIQGAGVLTGFLGNSIFTGDLVTDMFGPGTVEFLLLILSTLFISMLLLTFQRRRTPPLHALPPTTLPANSQLSLYTSHPMNAKLPTTSFT